jgi:Fe-S-cluster-containing dehydrogenase component
MMTVRRKPILVDGKLRQYHTVAPVLDKCAACVKSNPTPLCVSGCSAGALFIGTFEEMAKIAEGRHCTIFTA